MGLKIKLDKKRARRLGLHLEKEHPITKGKIFLDGKKLSGTRKKK